VTQARKTSQATSKKLRRSHLKGGDSNLIGIIGGSGFYDIPEIESKSQVRVNTPFGEPSDNYIKGELRGVEVLFLARHGARHKITAPGINFRANIYGFKSLGVEAIIGFSAVGSLRAELAPRDVVIPDQIIDLARQRESTFFKDNPSVHVSMAHPTCAALNRALYDVVNEEGSNVQLGGVYVCIEGPAFSSRAESMLYRSWGVDVIGMTAATEAKLCREAEICYSSLTLVTDYDAWKDDSEDVTVDIILENLRKNAETSRRILREAILHVPDLSGCNCRSALSDAIATNPNSVPDVTRTRLRVLLEKYLPAKE